MKKQNVFMALLFMMLFIISGCFKDDPVLKQVTNDMGAIVEGGEFKEGSYFVVEQIDSLSEEGTSIVELIENETYDKNKAVYIYELSVEKDNIKVQPKGKVKVIIPVSDNLKDYDVLHLLNNGSIKRINAKYSNGLIEFETDSFSKFVFVAKLKAIVDETKKYTIKINAEPWRYGQIRDENDEILSYESGVQVLSNTILSLKAYNYPDYVFIGWYNNSDMTLISKDMIYQLTVDEDIDIIAKFVYKKDIIELDLNGSIAGFSYVDGKPVTTLYAIGSTEKPDPYRVYVSGIRADNSPSELFGSYNENEEYNEYTIDDGGLDYNVPGIYTITYTYKKDTTVKSLLTIEVVEKGYEFSFETFDKDCLSIYYNNGYDYTSYNNYSAKIPAGKPITIEATLIEGQAFVGWYLVDKDGNVSNTKVSDKVIYSFRMPDYDYRLYAKSQTGELVFLKSNYGGNILDEDDNLLVSYNWQKNYAFLPGATVILKAQAIEGYEFEGWYRLYSYDKEVKLTDNEILEYQHEGIVDNIEARFKPLIVKISINNIEDDGFVDGKLQYAIGDVVPKYQEYIVEGKSVNDSTSILNSNEYTIEDNDISFTKVGTYTITYIYKKNASIKAQLIIQVFNPDDVDIVYQDNKSHLSHKYNGKAVFISPKDITVNGICLEDFTCKTILDAISYQWVNLNTNEIVNTKDGDVTINGFKVANYGPENDKMVVGGEFVGPIKVGEYQFSLSYKNAVIFTASSTIEKNEFKKISSKNDFKTNEGSSWVNFELYYYTIVGVVDNDLYVMQMPSIGKSNIEADARLVTTNSSGNIELGQALDFAFVNARYYIGENTDLTEFLTGYYGSYVIKSSDNSSSGLFGSPYIYRTGYTSVSGGHIYREYGDKTAYGNKTDFLNDGSVNIYSPSCGETENDRLRLVKDGNKYVFTSIPADTDSRDSYPIYIYQNCK